MIETIIRNFNIDRILYILKKRLAIMILFGVIGGIAAGIYAESTASTTYRAKVSFFVYSNPNYVYETSVNLSASEFNLAKSLVLSYTLVLRSNTMMEKVIRELGLTYSPQVLASCISTSQVEDTAVFYVYVVNADAYRAMEIANTIADVAPSVLAGVVKSGGIEVIDYATLPTSPYTSTNVVKYVIIGAAAGFAVPFVLFMFFGLLDTTIRKKKELTDAFDIPIIGEIPSMPSSTKRKKVSKIIDETSAFGVKEAYNALCTNLLYTSSGEKCPIYAVTSAKQDEGKSLSSINLAKSLSLLGKKTLLIDADMRNSSIGKYLEHEEEHGLAQYLARIDKTPNIMNQAENFDVLYTGELPPNPAELLAGARLAELFEKLKEEYDYVIIDLPPISAVSDAFMLKDKVVGYIIVVRADYSKLTTETPVIEEFERMEASISGIIFNDISAKAGNGYGRYGYGYGYGYGQNKKQVAGNSKTKKK